MDVAQLSIAVDSRDVKGATSAMDRMSDSGSKLEGVVKAIAAAWASFKIVQYAKDAATMAARYETLGVVMGVVGNNAGYTRAQMDAYAESLQKAGISMVESRNSLAVMAQSHIDLAKAQQLGRLAQDAAVVGNINSSEAFKTLIHGIQSGQTEVLRTIGINVNFENSYNELAKSMKVNATQLSEQEKVYARTNAVLSKAKDLTGAYEAAMGTAGKQLLSVTRYAEDLQTVFGALFSDAFGVVVQTLNGALQDTKKWLVDNANAAATMKLNLGLAAENFVGLVKDVLGVASGMASLNGELGIGEILAGGLALSMAGVRDVVVHMLGIFQVISGVLTGIISGAIYGMTKLVGMISGFQPPAWMKNAYDSSVKRFSSGLDNLQTGNVKAFYNGPDTNLQSELDKNLAALTASTKAEKDRINAGNQARADIEAKAKADAAAALAAQAHAAAILHKVEVLKWENDTYEKLADSRSKAADAAIKDNLALQDFITSIDPARAEAEKMAQVQYDLGWALAEGIIPNQEEYNRLLDLARDKFTAAGQAAEAYQKSIVRDVERLNNPGAEDRRRLEDQLKNGLSPEVYSVRLRQIRSQERQFAAEQGDIWAGMGMVVEGYTDHAAEVLANFFNGTKTGFSDMVRSILLDMEKMILKQQLIKGMDWATSYNWGSLFSGAGSSSSGPVDWSNPNSMPTMANPSSGSTPSAAPIIVNISTTGEASVKGGDSSDAKKLGALVGAKVREVITQERRSGGLLNPV